MRPFRNILSDCHKATRLAVKREVTSLTAMEWLQLKYHMFHCSLCRNFASQSRLLDQALQHIRYQVEKDPPFRLSAQTRDAITQKLDALKDG